MNAVGQLLASNKDWRHLRNNSRLAITEKCELAYSLVSSHEGSRYLEKLSGRRECAEMAMRLSRWLGQSAALPPTLDQAISGYEQDGCWVDWARHQLLAGDEPEGVSRSYRELFDKVTARREGENRPFVSGL